jgi:Mg2+ and Co2+ transporter CorA
MSDEAVKVKEIHASLERIRRISMLRDRVVELLTRMIEAEQEYIKRLKEYYHEQRYPSCCGILATSQDKENRAKAWP